MNMTPNCSPLGICQDLAKQCLKLGAPFTFSFSPRNGCSFSTSGRSSSQKPLFDTNPTMFGNFIQRKTPSQRRRDQRRWEAFQEKKSSPSTATATAARSSVEQSPTVESSPTVSLEPASKVDSPSFSEPEISLRSQSAPTEKAPVSAEPSQLSSQNPMEVDSPLPPPSMVSPLTSPTGPAVFSSAGKPGEDLLIALDCEDEKSATASLQRTLRKANLKSTKPKLKIIKSSPNPRTFCYILSSKANRFSHVFQAYQRIGSLLKTHQ